MLHRHSHTANPAAVHAELLHKRDELAATLTRLDQTSTERARDRDWVDAAPQKAPERPDLEDPDLRSTTERELKQVQHAIERQDAGLYGVCEVCGGPIDHGRLVSIPEVTHCSRCAEDKPS